MNPKNVSAMTLRSGREVKEPELMTPKDKSEDRIEKELEEEGMRRATPKVIPNSMVEVRSNPPPYSKRLEMPKKEVKKKEILEVFLKVKINIPLLDAIK
mgnify:CR=1 FL=1